MFYIAGSLIIAAVAIVIYRRMRSAEALFVDELLAKYKLDEEYSDQVAPGVERSFRDRILTPVTRKSGLALGGALPRAFLKTTAARLTRAGFKERPSASEFVGIRLICALVGVLIAVALAHGMGALITVLLVVVLSFALWLAPDIYLGQIISERQRLIWRALPDTIDLLTVSVEAGRGFDEAMRNVAVSLRGPLSEELDHVLRDIEVGKPRIEALREMSERVGMIEMGGLVAAVYEADRLGASIADVLRAQSEDLRVRRFQLAREAAQKLPLLLLFPMALFIFPAIFVVVLGPAAIHVLRTVSQMK